MRDDHTPTKKLGGSAPRTNQTGPSVSKRSSEPRDGGQIVPDAMLDEKTPLGLTVRELAAALAGRPDWIDDQTGKPWDQEC